MASSILIPLKTVFDDKGLKQAQSSFGKLGGSLKGILGAAGIAVGFSAIASGIRDATKAAIEDTKSQALLANQLRNTVGATDGQIASVEQSIKAMQMQASVADDVIRPAFASLVRATGDVEQATGLTNLALDVAAGTGKDLGAVSLALGKAINGSSTSLQKLVPSIKGAADPMAELSRQFDGAAEAAANNDPIQRLNIIFGELQETIGVALLPYLEDFANYMASDSGAQDIQDFADAIISVADAVKTLTPLIGDLFAGFKTVPYAFSQLLNNPGEFFKIMSMNTGDALKYINSKEADKSRLDPGLARALAGRTTTGTITGTGAGGGGKTGGAAKAATDYVKEFSTTMADELRKNMARIRLGNKGLSEGLIESIIGSGKGWYTVYQSILTSSDTALGRLQKNWNATASGTKELEAIAQEAADAASKIAEAAKEAAEAAAQAIKDATELAEDTARAAAETAQVVADLAAQAAIEALRTIADTAEAAYDLAANKVSDLQKIYDMAKSDLDKFAGYFETVPPTVFAVYDQAVQNLADVEENARKTLETMAAGMQSLRSELDKSTATLKQLANTAQPVGEWEAKVNDSFASVAASVQNAFDNKLITEDAYKNLLAYADREKRLLADIAKKRDALAEKISLAKALYSDTRAAVIGFGNITGLLKQQAETVTETTSKIIDGVAVTISRSIEKITSSDLVAEYKKIIDKTRAFATNLNALKSMGLNKDLFKQIIDAGVDVGGETAAAIAAGGPAVVGELNGLFAELQTVGDQVAEATTVVMYNNGVDVVGGFINGLIAEDEGLAAAAKTIATTFADAFSIQVENAMSAVITAMKMQLDAAIAAAKTAMDAAKAELQKAQDLAIAAANAAMASLNKAKSEADIAAAALAKAQKDAADAADAMAKAKSDKEKADAEAAAAKAKAEADAAAAALKALTDSGNAVTPNPIGNFDGNTSDYMLVGRGAGQIGFKGGTSLVDGGATINLTVNAGLGTNGAQLGGQIVELIKKYEKSSGAVFA